MSASEKLMRLLKKASIGANISGDVFFDHAIKLLDKVMEEEAAERAAAVALENAVIDAFKKLGKLKAFELAELLEEPSFKINPVLHDLRERGVLKAEGKPGLRVWSLA